MAAERHIVLVDDEQSILNSLRREISDWATELDLDVSRPARPWSTYPSKARLPSSSSQTFACRR
jgi:hypothetical protein